LGIVAYGTLLIAGRESVAPVIEKRAYEGLVMAETGLKQAMFGLLDETAPPIGDEAGAFTPGIDVSLGSAEAPTDLLAGDPKKCREASRMAGWRPTRATSKGLGRSRR